MDEEEAQAKPPDACLFIALDLGPRSFVRYLFLRCPQALDDIVAWEAQVVLTAAAPPHGK